MFNSFPHFLTSSECLRSMFRSGNLAKEDKTCRKVIAQRIQASEIDLSIDPILQDACSLDLVKFCRNVPAKDAKKLQCLFYILRQEDPSSVDKIQSSKMLKEINKVALGTDSLRKECVDVLKKRSEMFRLAVRELPYTADAIRDVNDLYQQISASPHRNYLLIVACSMLLIIFIGGLVCGRVTKRARREYVQKVR